MSDENKVSEAARALADFSESPIYKDAVQPGATEVGKAFGTLGKTLNVVLAPLKVLVWGYEQIEDFLIRRLSEKLDGVPSDRIVTPDLTIAGPAVEALKFSGHKKELREMYANLLATTIDRDTAREAHPSFVEVIKQLSPDEAKILKFMDGYGEPYPVIDLDKQKKKTSSVTIFPSPAKPFQHVESDLSLLGSDANCEHQELVPNYIDNLRRLRLIEKVSDFRLSEGRYEELERFLQLQERSKKMLEEGEELLIRHRFVQMTTFGKQFCSACVVSHKVTRP